MLRTALILAWIVGAPTLVVAEQARPAASDYAELIEQLGRPLYEQRAVAQRRLRSEGLRAFDALLAGKQSTDPEVADACERLLQELTSDLSRRDDPSTVRQLLHAYNSAPNEVIARLSIEPIDVAVAGLARLARFAPSDYMAAEAARRLLAAPELTPDPRRERAIVQVVERLDAEHGLGTRPTAEWVRLAANEASTGRPDPEAWRAHVEALTRRLDREPDSTSVEALATLHWRWLRSALVAESDRSAIDAIELLLRLDEEDAGERFAKGVRWAATAGRLQVVEELSDGQADRLTGKRGLYLSAEIAALSGDSAEADRLAAEALATPPDDEDLPVEAVILGPRLVQAQTLYDAGLAEWAIAEYRAAAEADDPLEGKACTAAWRLSALLFDYERYAEAAEALEPIAKVIDRSRSKRREFNELPQVQNGYLPRTGGLISRYRFSVALAARASGDQELELSELRRAIAADSDDADVLIAMHRVEDPPSGFAADTRRRIDAMRRKFEEDIWDSPGEAGPFNQWAWLVANTEGDFEKAVRYSRRSLQISPDTAGYLDTLGRCLFSAGRLEEALEVQRRAVELEPRMQVLRRQLEEFERAAGSQQDQEQ